MHKSLSVSRQGTFDTGPAHLDKRGSIRRGDVELPVVDEPRSKPTSSTRTHDDSGISSQTPSSKEPSSETRGPESVESREQAPEREPSPRYVDHNILFPETPVKRNARSTNEDSGYVSLYKEKRKHEKKRSPRRTEPTAVKKKEERGGDERRHENEKNTFLINGDSSGKGDDDQNETKPESSSTVVQTQTHGKHQADVLTPLDSGKSSENNKGSRAGGRSVQNDNNVGLNRIKEKEEKSFPKEHHQQHNISNTPTEPLSSRNQQEKTAEQPYQKHPQQQQSQQLQRQQHQKQELQTSADPIKEDSKTKKAAKTPANTPSPSLELTKNKQQQQQQSSSTTDAKSRQTEKQLPNDLQQQQQQQQQQEQQKKKNVTPKAEIHPQHTEKKNDSAVKTPSTSTPNTSTSKSSHHTTKDLALLPQQPSPVLLSTPRGSAPPQDHKHQANNPSTKKIDTPRDRKQTAKVAPQTKTDSVKDSKESAQEKAKAEQNIASEGNISKVQPQGQSVRSTMAQKQENSLDSLSQVTAERDQLLKNEKTYKQRILQLEEEVKVTVKQSQDLAAENRLLSNKLESVETKVYGGSLELKELRREKQDLVTQVARTTAEKQEMDAENERLRSKLAEADSKTRQWDALYVENNKLKTKQAELERKIVELENEKLKLKNNVRTAESTQLDKLAAVQNENKKLEADLINLQTKNNAMERKVERMDTENKELEERLGQKKTELDELMRAMKSETNTELELKEVNQELEFAKNKSEDLKKDLNEANHRYEVLEKEKDSVKNALRLKESECKGLKATSEEKDTQIGELKRQVDTAKRNVKRLEDDLEDTKQVEKDVVNMKARVRSLKNEIEDSLSQNHKMKQERTEARLEADRLNRELAATSEALTEARRYIKKLEGERSSRDKLEEELRSRKQREQELERQAYEMNMRSEQLRTRVRMLEEEKEDFLKRDVNEMHALNRKLQDDNKKLRQLMVERNMEIAQRQSERHTLKDRVDHLERKQNDSDIKVQQLKGWVQDVYTSTSPTGPQGPNYHHPHPTVALPPVPPKAARKSKPAGGDGTGVRRKKGQNLSQQQRQHQLNRSWEDLNRLKAEPDESIRTTPGLPGVGDGKAFPNSLPANPGYFDLYKSKMKLIRERKW